MDTDKRVKPNVPPLFRAIIKNDAEREELKGRQVIPFETACRLARERRDFTRQAEKVLVWNVDKGNKPR